MKPVEPGNGDELLTIQHHFVTMVVAQVTATLSSYTSAHAMSTKVIAFRQAVAAYHAFMNDHTIGM